MEKVEERAIDTVQLVTFLINDETYGSKIIKVQEIIWMTPITRVPKAEPHIIGVINLRGQIIPIISLAKRMELSQGARRDEFARIVIFKAEEQVAGVIVDSVSEVAKVPMNRIEPPPDVSSDSEHTYIEGIAKMEKRVIIILDVNKIVLGAESGAESGGEQDDE